MYSIKMRATKNRVHISGTEHVVEQCDVDNSVIESVLRAVHHSRGCPDEIMIKLEEIEKSHIVDIPSLPVITIKTEDMHVGREFIETILRNSIQEIVTYDFLDKYIYTDCPYIKGAKVFDISSPDVININQNEDIRVTNLDLSNEVVATLRENIERYEVFNFKTADGLAIASKVCSCRGVLAEVCVSDDPNYQGGYIAFPNIGYIRIDKLKKMGSTVGGRVIVIDGKINSLDNIRSYLEKTTTLISFAAPVSKINNIGHEHIVSFINKLYKHNVM